MTNQQHLLHYTWSVLLIGIVLSANAQAASPPFFYQNHRQVCHCSGGKRCNSDGSCSPDMCARPYYGNTCQHGGISLVMKTPPNIDKKLLDNNDETCLDNFHGNAHFVLPIPLHFIWIYVCRKYKKEIKPTLKLLYYKSELDLSNSMYVLAISDNSWLIKLRTEELFEEIQLSRLPHDTCSLEISIGRNLATSSRTYIATYFTSTMPQQAEANKGIGGCSRIAVSTALYGSDWWRAKFISSARINRILVRSNVRSKCGSWKFKVEYQASAKRVLMVTQEQPSSTTSDTTNIEVFITHLVSEVELALKKTDNNVCNSTTSVDICEVAIYGELTCPDKMYGPLCETHCPDGCNREICDPDWACPNGCKQGWNGTWCNHKCEFRYGPRCDHLCSDKCAGIGDCDTNTGQCIEGCKPGFFTEKCTSACMQGSFGLNCTKICDNCRRNKTTNAYACDPATGECLLGCSQAFGGDNCEKINIVDDPLSKVSKYHWAALTLLVILLLYKSITRAEEEASEEEVAQEDPENDEGKVEEVEEERPPPEDIPSPETILAPKDILEQGSRKEEHVEPEPKEEEQLHQPHMEVEPEEDIPEQGSHFAEIFSMIPREGSDEDVVISTQ